MSGVHPIVLATIRKHRAEAELMLARLESAGRTVPAMTRSSIEMNRNARKVREARDILAAWKSVEREASA